MPGHHHPIEGCGDGHVGQPLLEQLGPGGNDRLLALGLADPGVRHGARRLRVEQLPGVGGAAIERGLDQLLVALPPRQHRLAFLDDARHRLRVRLDLRKLQLEPARIEPREDIALADRLPLPHDEVDQQAGLLRRDPGTTDRP